MVIFDNSIYSSGFSVKSAAGEKGLTGNQGKAIFYVPYDLRTSNNIKFVLNRIKYNQTVNAEAITLPDERKYTIYDIFVDSNGIKYKLNEGLTDFIVLENHPYINSTIKNVIWNNNILKFDADFDNYEYEVLVRTKESDGSIKIVKYLKYIQESGCDLSELAGTGIQLSNISVVIRSLLSGNTLIYDLDKTI